MTDKDLETALDHCNKAMAGRSRIPETSKTTILGMIREDLIKFNIKPKTQAEVEALITRAELLHYIKHQEERAKSNAK